MSLNSKTKEELIEIIETYISLVESLCGERYELKSEINILQTILRTSIPDFNSGEN